mmetsp:Transcript_23176/g.54190  ORF Transcript_23176/g.54190 Transcript_23176/m.54190 type:complete len:200 (-) Transcript_23176:313-912(-)
MSPLQPVHRGPPRTSREARRPPSTRPRQPRAASAGRRGRRRGTCCASAAWRLSRLIPATTTPGPRCPPCPRPSTKRATSCSSRRTQSSCLHLGLLPSTLVNHRAPGRHLAPAKAVTPWPPRPSQHSAPTPRGATVALPCLRAATAAWCRRTRPPRRRATPTPAPRPTRPCSRPPRATAAARALPRRPPPPCTRAAGAPW